MRLTRVVPVLPVVVACGFLVARSVSAAPGCMISATLVAFGNYDAFATLPTDSMGTITYRCTGLGNAGTVTISLDAGTWSPTSAQRQMASISALGQNLLPYNLYTDPARTQLWGDQGNNAQQYGPVHPPNGRSVAVPVYGRIQPHQDVAAGSYSDVITATINF